MRFPKTIRLADKSQYADAERVFHLVFAAHPEVPAFTPQVRAALWESLMEQRTAGRVELFAACLMPDTSISSSARATAKSSASSATGSRGLPASLGPPGTLVRSGSQECGTVSVAMNATSTPSPSTSFATPSLPDL
ncbi:hypothetical protein [Candidatus Amarobacter glycogenicus]|uniref:hypothetical protein n=1 Tax=Candidatus Amarobacter glycogenicus TaxID=3140699 RepID=UPI002A0F6EF4|nr:hypothetical protein [Dehalococcoidia bacterium]